MARRFPLFLILMSVFGLNGCGGVSPADMTVTDDAAPLVLKPARYEDLDGWNVDNHAQALAAFEKSCARILKGDAARPFGPDGIGGTFGDWHAPCRAVQSGQAAADPKAFFEKWFVPVQATAGGTNTEGLFTGYYEASLRGSKTRKGPYQTALRLRPADLVMVDLGEFREELRGQRIAGRVRDGRLKPYEPRADILKGALSRDEDLTFVWVDDPVDAFFLEVQGSGRVLMEDGSTLRVGYAGQNGHPYYAIGRELIKRGHLQKDEVSMQAIRTWLAANPQEAVEVMNLNKSYVFFEVLTGAGPLGGENVALTPGRSLAIDRSRMPYGMPVWLQTDAPGAENEPPLRRLMVAQDTGGAIRGAVRGDVYWGFGDRAENLAGVMKARGRYWLLLPRTSVS